MSAQTEADIRKLQQQMEAMQGHIAHIYAAIGALVEQHENATIEGDDVKASSNGKIKKGSHR